MQTKGVILVWMMFVEKLPQSANSTAKSVHKWMAKHVQYRPTDHWDWQDGLPISWGFEQMVRHLFHPYPSMECLATLSLQ